MKAIFCRENWSYATRKKLLIGTFSSWMFFFGVEYSVILPSVWFYLDTFHVQYWYLGVVLSAFAGVGAILSPVFGLIADKTRKVRLLCLFCTVTEVIGNLIYACTFSKYMPLIGRAIAGVGGSYVSVMNGEVGRITTVEERTSVFSIIEGCRLFGILVGPCCNLFLQYWSFDIKEWRIDFRNSPGLFMSGLWIILAVISMVLMTDLSASSEYIYEMIVPVKDGKDGHPEDGDNDEVLMKKEDTRELVHGNHNGKTYSRTDEPSSFASRACLPQALKELAHVEFIVLIWSQFFMVFSMLALDSFSPLYLKQVLNWNETSVSIWYLVVGLLLIVTVFGVGLVSKKCPDIQDRHLLLFSMVSQAVGLPFLFWLAHDSRPRYLTAVFLGIGVTIIVGVPCTLVAGRTLLTKLSKEEHMSFNQGVLMAVNSLATICGPLAGTYMFDKLDLFGSVMNILNVGTLILAAVSFKKLLPSDSSSAEVKSDKPDTG